MQKITFISIVIGLCILTIVGVGVWLMLARTTSAQQSMAGGTILYVFSAIPAVFGIGLAIILVAGVVFFLLKTTAMYHRSISHDTIEVMHEFNGASNRSASTTNVIVGGAKSDLRKLSSKSSNSLQGFDERKLPKYNGRGKDGVYEVPELDAEFFDNR